MKRNKRLLLKTAKRIEEIPESYEQNTWCAADDRSPCGTVACLAGEIIICSERSVAKGIEKLEAAIYGNTFVSTLALRLAGLEDSNELENKLFYSPAAWPNGIGKGFYRKNKEGKAKAAATLLRYLADGGQL